LERKGRVVTAELGFQIGLFVAKAVKNDDQLDILEICRLLEPIL